MVKLRLHHTTAGWAMTLFRAVLVASRFCGTFPPVHLRVIISPTAATASAAAIASYSYCRRCFLDGCLAATDFRTVVWFSFYTLAEKQRAMCTARLVEQDCTCVRFSLPIFIDSWYFAAFTLNQYFNYSNNFYACNKECK